MVRERTTTEVEPGEVKPEVEPGAEYGLHVRLEREMQSVLEAATQLAYKMGEIPKPTVAELINLYINWGLAIQKRKWLDRVGYR